MYTFRGLLTSDEVDYLLHSVDEQKFERSLVLTKDGEEVEDTGRTSSTAFLTKSADAVIECIEHKLSHAAGRPHDHMEALQLTRYRETQRYDPHHDAFDEPNVGQRTTTIFTNLKGVDRPECGGATSFPALRDATGDYLRVPSETGVSVRWENLTHNGYIEERSMHGGEPLLCPREKIGLNAWWQDRPVE